MKRAGLLLFFLFLIPLIAGCAKKGTSLYTYVSKNAEYTMDYPFKWAVLDSQKELSILMNKYKEKHAKNAGKLLTPEVVFGRNEGLEGKVVIVPESEVANMRSSGLDDHRIFDLVFSSAQYEGGKSVHKNIRTINGKEFQVEKIKMGGIVILGAACFHHDRIYVFHFMSPSGDFNKWEPVFVKAVDSISFKKADIEAGKKKLIEKEAGFFTGLWHGFLGPFRLMASFFWDVDVYADNNTGNGYLLGFILGIMFITGGGGAGSSGRRNY